jgi:hypothetical protein
MIYKIRRKCQYIAYSFIPAETLSKFYCRIVLGYIPKLMEPNTLNEKLQWLKLNWYDERAIICSDKYLVRDYIKSKGYGDMLNELYAAYDSADDIDFGSLPDQFVLKTTHDSGHNIICKHAADMDQNSAKRKLSRWLDVDYEYIGCEWAYSNKHKRIVCERYLESTQDNELTDYKFYCFNGEPRFLYVSYGQYTSGGIKMDFYDTNWNRIDVRRGHYPNGTIQHKKPSCYDKMIECAKDLANGFPFVRIDFLEHNNSCYFGEMTFFPGGGTDQYIPDSFDVTTGSYLCLPQAGEPWKKIHPELADKWKK